jgi:hypothetical protein
VRRAVREVWADGSGEREGKGGGRRERVRGGVRGCEAYEAKIKGGK